MGRRPISCLQGLANLVRSADILLVGNENRNDKAAGKKSTKKVGTFNKAVKPPSNAAATKKSKEKTWTVLALLTDVFNVTIDQR